MEKYALIIGIENYPSSSGQEKVKYAKNDAIEMAKYAQIAGFQLIGNGPILDGKATYSQVIEYLDLMFNYVSYEDFVLLYYAGHGHYSEYGGYLIPYDYNLNNEKNESTCISFDSINKRLKSKKPAKFVFLLDTCHSGFAGKQIDIRAGNFSKQKRISKKARFIVTTQLKKMIQTSKHNHFIGRVVFTSSGYVEPSIGIDEYKHGLYTYYLIQCLKSKSYQPEINIEELILLTKKKVLSYSINHHLRQTPVAYTNIQGEFYIPTYQSASNDDIVLDGPTFTGNAGTHPPGSYNHENQVTKNKTPKKKGIFKRFLSFMLLMVLIASTFLVIKIFERTSGKLYVTNLSFMDGGAFMPLADIRLKNSIDDAVLKGMKRAKQPPINHFSFKISDAYEHREKLKNIIFDPNLTNGEKIKRIVKDIMAQLDVDAIVSVLYIHHESLITIRPLIIVRDVEKIATKNLQFSKPGLFCQDPIKKEKILCDEADQEISRAVQELIQHFNLENMYIKTFPFLDVKSSSSGQERIYSFMKDKEEEELINKSLLHGIYEVQGITNPNQELAINAPCHLIRNSESDVNVLVNIFFSRNLSETDKINKIIDKIMAPYNVDIIVCGEYIDNSENSWITVRPIIIVKELKKISFKTIQLERKEIVNVNINTVDSNVLSKVAYGLIVQAVQELLERL